MAFCQNCGAKLEEGVRFCPNCGSAVEGNTAGKWYSRSRQYTYIRYTDQWIHKRKEKF